MAIHTRQGEEDLQWCLRRALLEYDAGSPEDALLSVLSDFTKCQSTQSIAPELVFMIVRPAAYESRAALEKAIMGFNV